MKNNTSLKKLLVLAALALSTITFSFAKTDSKVNIVSTTTEEVVMNIKVNADTNLVGYINVADQETAAVYLSERVGEFKIGQSEIRYTYKKSLFKDRETNVIFSLKDNLNRISVIEFVAKIPAVKSAANVEKSLLIDNCNLTVDKATTTYQVLGGPSVTKENKLYLNCVVKINNENLDFAYSVSKRGETSKVIATGEVKGVKDNNGFYIEMPRQTVPQGYDVSIYMIDGNKNRLSNDLLVKYIEFGPQANINNLDYVDGNILVKTVFIGNPFDAQDTQLPRYNAEIEYQVTNNQDVLCIAGLQSLNSPIGIVDTKIMLENSCKDDMVLNVNVKVTDTTSKLQLANFDKVITLEKSSATAMGWASNRNILIAVSILIFVGLAGGAYMINKRYDNKSTV